MGLFKKLTSGASNFFKKAGGSADNFFRKASNTVSDAADIAGREIVRDGKVVGGGLKQAGNFLEKNSGVISDVAAAGLYATGFGAPAATAVLAAGNSAQQFGGRLKGAGNSVQQFSQNANATLSTKSDALTNTINQARQSVANKTASTVNTINSLQPSNNLAALHANLAT